MDGTELHVQASIWRDCLAAEKRDRQVRHVVLAYPRTTARGPDPALPVRRRFWLPRLLRASSHRTDVAVLVLEGEAPSGAGGEVSWDALYRAVLARGLILITDLDHIAANPVPGWKLAVDDSGAFTLGWPAPIPS